MINNEEASNVGKIDLRRGITMNGVKCTLILGNWHCGIDNDELQKVIEAIEHKIPAVMIDLEEFNIIEKFAIKVLLAHAGYNVER